MKCDGESLYRIYSNKTHTKVGIKARMKQRLKWRNSYKENGSCQRKCEQAGIIKPLENENVT